MPEEVSPLPDHVRRFLESPYVAAVATVDQDGAPRQAIAWFRVEPDGRILLNSRLPRRWPANLLRDGRVAIAVTDPADGYVWAGLTGVVEAVIHGDQARDDIVALAHRYHPEGPSPESIAVFRGQERITFLVRITGLHDHLGG